LRFEYTVSADHIFDASLMKIKTEALNKGHYCEVFYTHILSSSPSVKEGMFLKCDPLENVQSVQGQSSGNSSGKIRDAVRVITGGHKTQTAFVMI